jgi:hypothetical protein
VNMQVDICEEYLKTNSCCHSLNKCILAVQICINVSVINCQTVMDMQILNYSIIYYISSFMLYLLSDFHMTIRLI